MEADEMSSKMIEAGLSQNRPKSMCGCGKTRPTKNVRKNVASRAARAIQQSRRQQKARRNVRALVKGYLFDAAIRRSASGLRQMHSVRDWRSLTWPDP